MLSRIKQKKIEKYQVKLNKIRKLSREQTLDASIHLQKSELIMETKHQFILRIFISSYHWFVNGFIV